MDQFLLVFYLHLIFLVHFGHAVRIFVHLLNLRLQISIFMAQFGYTTLQFCYLAQLVLILGIQRLDFLIQIGLQLRGRNLLVLLDLHELIFELVLYLLVVLDLLVGNLDQHVLVMHALTQRRYFFIQFGYLLIIV